MLVNILAIDPGFDRLGWAVAKINSQSGEIIYETLIYDLIATKKELNIYQRYWSIYQQVNQIIQKYHPSHLALETVLFAKNTKTAFLTSQVRGILIITAMQNKVTVYDYNPNQIKLAATGYGKADKKSIKKVIDWQLAKHKRIIDDVYDAIAILITHAQNYKQQQIINKYMT